MNERSYGQIGFDTYGDEGRPHPWKTFDGRDFDWFGFKLGKISRRVFDRHVYLAPLSAHRRFNGRDCASQGFSLLQIDTRHLVYVGSNDGQLRVCLGFVWLTRETPHG